MQWRASPTSCQSRSNTLRRRARSTQTPWPSRGSTFLRRTDRSHRLRLGPRHQSKCRGRKGTPDTARPCPKSTGATGNSSQRRTCLLHSIHSQSKTDRPCSPCTRLIRWPAHKCQSGSPTPLRIPQARTNQSGPGLIRLPDLCTTLYLFPLGRGSQPGKEQSVHRHWSQSSTTQPSKRRSRPSSCRP
jgi:hypothetical protein